MHKLSGSDCCHISSCGDGVSSVFIFYECSKFYTLMVQKHIKLTNPSGSEDRSFQENTVNTMAANDLAPCVTRSSAAIVPFLKLPTNDEWMPKSQYLKHQI